MSLRMNWKTSRKNLVLLLACITLLVFLISFTTSISGKSINSINALNNGKVENQVLQMLERANENNGGKNIRVIIELKEPGDIYSKSHLESMSQGEKAALRESIKQALINAVGKEKVKRKFSSINGFSASLTQDDISLLAADENVKMIYYDYPVQAFLQDSAPLVNATKTWQALSNGTNITGAGEAICVIDTGINYTHVDFGACSIRNFSLNGNVINYTLESAHNYSNNYDNTWKINYTGFTNMAVHFANISLEYQGEFLGLDSADRMIIYSSNGTEIASYHGINGIIQDVWTPSSGSDTIYVRLVTDAGITDYGFYIDQIINGTTNTTYNWSSCKKVPFGWDFVNNDADPFDDNGHGTHVSGIIAANGTIKGIAPDARIVSAKVLNSAGAGWGSDIMYAIEFCTNNSLTYNISVISMSLGSGSYSGYCNSDALASSVNAAIAKNISVVAATGNSGSATGISSPACIQNATAVAATSKDDAIASYSDRNNLTDMLAPGSSINSTIGLCPAGVSNCANGYGTASGTSMATPHVSAAFALLRQFKRQETGRILTPLEIQNALNSTGRFVYDTATGINLSRINIYAAILIIDETAPAVALIEPADNFAYASLNETFLCNATDLQLKNITLSIWNSTSLHYKNTTNVTGIFNLSSFNATGISLVNYKWNCQSCDANNNCAYASQNFTLIYDTTPPSIQLNVQNNSLLNAARLNVSLNENASWCGISINSAVNASMTRFNDTYFNYTNITIADGQYNASIFCNDSAGNVNSTGISFSIDKIPANISTAYPQSITYSYNVIQLNYTVSADAQACWFSLNNGATNQTITCGTNITGANSSEGNNTWLVSANDSAGNVNFSSAAFVKDTSAPSITLSSPADGTSTTSTSITFSYSASDISNIANCSLILNNATDQTSSSITKDTTQSFTKTLSVAGYTWSINCTDIVNNKGNSAIRSLAISSSSGSGGSGSGGDSGGSISSSSSSKTGKTYTLTEQQFTNGYTREMAKNEQFKFDIIKGDAEEYHTARLIELAEATTTIEVSSETQTAMLSVGEEKRFDVTSDNYYDLSIKLNGIAGSRANITIKAINEFFNLTASAPAAGNAPEAGNASNTNSSTPITAKAIKETISKIFNHKNIIIIVSAAIVLVAATFLVRFMKKWKKRY